MCSSSSAVSARRMRLFACPRSPSRIKFCRDSTAFTICGTTVSSYPIIPGNTGSFAFSRAIRFSRISSFTVRVRSRVSLYSRLPRSAPSVCGRWTVRECSMRLGVLCRVAIDTPVPFLRCWGVPYIGRSKRPRCLTRISVWGNSAALPGSHLPLRAAAAASRYRSSAAARCGQHPSGSPATAA